MEKASDVIAQIVLNRPKTCFLLSLLLCVVLLPGLRLAGESYDIKGWFDESNSHRNQLEEFEDHFGNDEKIIVAVHDPGGLFDPESVKVIREITDRLWEFPPRHPS